MTERKRGYSLKDFEARKEAEELAPYPSWDGWKHTLYKMLEERGLELPKDHIEEILHRFYVLRRRIQLGQEEIDSIGEFNKFLDERHPGIFEEENVREAFRFITEKTTKKPDR